MLSLSSEKTGLIDFAGLQAGLTDANLGSAISRKPVIRPEFQAELFNFRFQNDELIIFSGVPWPCALIFVFGYSITIFLNLNSKKQIHDRGMHLIYTPDLSFKIYFQKERNYNVIFFHYSPKFILKNLGDNNWFQQNGGRVMIPRFYYGRSIIAERDQIEQLAMFWFPKAGEPNEDFIKDEVGRSFLMDFVNNQEHLFQPAYLGARDFENFYAERDRLITQAFRIQPLSSLVILSRIHPVSLFRKRLHQLYNLNIRDFITQIRMGRALQLLMDPTLSIKEISAMTGFKSAFYFSRVFSNYFDQPPKFFHAKHNL